MINLPLSQQYGFIPLKPLGEHQSPETLRAMFPGMGLMLPIIVQRVIAMDEKDNAENTTQVKAG
jgi:hypothetical protein